MDSSQETMDYAVPPTRPLYITVVAAIITVVSGLTIAAMIAALAAVGGAKDAGPLTALMFALIAFCGASIVLAYYMMKASWKAYCVLLIVQGLNTLAAAVLHKGTLSVILFLLLLAGYKGFKEYADYKANPPQPVEKVA